MKTNAIKAMFQFHKDECYTPSCPMGHEAEAELATLQARIEQLEGLLRNLMSEVIVLDDGESLYKLLKSVNDVLESK